MEGKLNPCLGGQVSRGKRRMLGMKLEIGNGCLG